jgi:hypothetical protein
LKSRVILASVANTFSVTTGPQTASSGGGVTAVVCGGFSGGGVTGGMGDTGVSGGFS